MIRVLIVDDHPLARRGVRLLLSVVSSIEVVGEAENAQEAIALVQALKPDVVVMDIAMPDMDGLQATETLQTLPEQVRVVMLSGYDDLALVERALAKGASGYLLKPPNTNELVNAVIAASRGQRFLSDGIPDAGSEEGGEGGPSSGLRAPGSEP